MIQTKSLYFKYEDDWILKNITLRIKKGSFTAILGANGSGKTTLAKHFNSLLIPAKGEVFVDGKITKKYPLYARKKIGFVFQNPEDQLVHSVVEEDIAFGLENLEVGQKEMKLRVSEALQFLGIEHLRRKNVNFLSAGQKQMVALAGVLVMEPECIVLDEPTTLLDAKNKKNIMGILTSLKNKHNKTIILVTNILEDLNYSERVVLLKAGSVIFDDKTAGLRKFILGEAGLYD